MRRIPVIVLLFLLSLAARAENVVHYVIFFSHQGPNNEIPLSHTFAEYIEARGEGADPRNYRVTSFTISWGPSSGEVRLLRPAETGVNRSLEATLADARFLNVRVSKWGPFQITAEGFQRAYEEYASLMSHRVGYKVGDRKSRYGRRGLLGRRPGPVAYNCIRAVLRPAGDCHTGAMRGDEATAFVVSRYRARGLLVQPDVVHPWVYERLGLHRYRIVDRTPPR